MKKLFAMITMLAFTAVMQADDFSLYYDTQSGAANAVCAVADAQKIVFDNGKMTVVKKDGTQQTTELSLVKRLYFSTPEAVGISETPALPNDAKAIHDLTGREVNAKSISELPKGVYIINGKKIAIR